MKSYTTLIFKSFSFEPLMIEKILDYREVPKLLEFTKQYLLPFPSLLRRRRPYIAGGPRPWRVRGQVDPRHPPMPPVLLLGSSSRAHASWRPGDVATTSLRLPAPPPHRPPGSDLPRPRLPPRQSKLIPTFNLAPSTPEQAPARGLASSTAPPTPPSPAKLCFTPTNRLRPCIALDKPLHIFLDL